MNKQISLDLFADNKPSISNEEIKQMNCQLIIWAYQYYAEDKSTATDQEYDGLYEEYKSLIVETDYRPFCDMSNKVGSPSRMAYHAALYGLKEKYVK